MELLESTHLPVFAPETLVLDFDASKATSMRHFYTLIAKTLKFEKNVGKNLDALFDSMSSLDAFEQAQITLLIHHAQNLLEKEKLAKKEAVLSVFSEVQIPENRYDDKIFKVYFLK